MAKIFNRFHDSKIPKRPPLKSDTKASQADVARMSGSSGPVSGPYGAKAHHSQEGDHRQAGHHQARGHVSPLGNAHAPYSTDNQKKQEAKNRAQTPRPGR
jgi:hypothetical protein